MIVFSPKVQIWEKEKTVNDFRLFSCSLSKSKHLYFEFENYYRSKRDRFSIIKFCSIAKFKALQQNISLHYYLFPK